MFIKALMVSLLFTCFTTAEAFAALTIDRCNYDVHGSETSSFVSEKYFQSSLEIKKSGANRFLGTAYLAGGFALRIGAVIDRGSVKLTADVRSPSETALSVSGIGSIPQPGKSKVFRLHKRGPSVFLTSPVEEGELITVFDRVTVECEVREATVLDRVNEWLF